MKPRSFLRCAAGATALEFALTAPLFFALLLGIGTIGIALYTNVALQHAVERAARCAAVNTTTCGSNTATQNYAVSQSYGLNPPAATFTVSTLNCGIQVQASYPVTLTLGEFGSPGVTLTASSCFPT